MPQDGLTLEQARALGFKPPNDGLTLEQAQSLGFKPASPPQEEVPGLFSGEYSGPDIERGLQGTVAPGESLPHAVGRQAIGGVGRGLKGLAQMFNPLPSIESKGEMAASLALPGIGLPMYRGARAQLEEAKKAYELAKSGEYSQAAGHGLAAAIPVAGPMVAGATEQAVKGTLGPAAELGTMVAAPTLAAKGAPLVGKGLKAVAVPIAEAALDVKGTGRAFGKTPGQAVLKETAGLAPAKILKSSREAMDRIGQKIEGSYQQAGSKGQTVSIEPAVKILWEALRDAEKGRQTNLATDIRNNIGRLSTDPATGKSKTTMTPDELWAIKKGQGDLTNWSANTDLKMAGKLNRKIYRAIDAELDRVAPEVAEFNQTYSSLKEVAKRADIEARAPGITQNVLSRIRAHTGALIGAVGGYAVGGPVGAIAGLITPELVGSPMGAMAAARALWKAGELLSPSKQTVAIPKQPRPAPTQPKPRIRLKLPKAEPKEE